MCAKPTKVLVADDEPHICQLIQDVLVRNDVLCTAVHSGEEARRLLLKESYDVLVLDMVMPGLNGDDLLKLIARRGLDTRVVCVTGVPQPDWGTSVLRAGAYDFFEKPFDASQLADVVLRAAADRRKLSGKALPAGEAPGQRPAKAVAKRGKAQTDSLTGLPSFVAFRKRLASARRRCRDRGTSCTALVVDLDDFAWINATYGYGFGDLVLVELARRIQRAVDPKAVAARGAGDEFLVLLPGRSADQADELAHRIRREINAVPLRCGGRQMPVTVSIGLAESDPSFQLHAASLLERARVAMRAARSLGGNGQVAYTDGMVDDPSAEGWHCQQSPLLSQQVNQVNRKLKRTLLESAGALVQAVEAKDPYTRRHSEHVSFYARQLAEHVGLPKAMFESIRIAGLLHDIGKIAVPDSVLTKPGKLSRQELSIIQRHPAVGAAILENISLLKNESRLVRFHHENWDGKGYPAGLAGELIPLGSRILNIADSMDAMLMNRSYKSAYSVEHMLEELGRCAGGQFDPALAQSAIDWCRKNPAQLILSADPPQAESA